MVNERRKDNRAVGVRLIFVICSVIMAAAFFLYFIFLITADESALKFETKSITGEARVIIYKGQPQLSVTAGDGDVVRVNCFLFDGNNSCLNNVVLLDLNGEIVSLSYLTATNLPISNNIVLDISVRDSLIVSCDNSVSRLRISNSYCDKVS